MSHEYIINDTRLTHDYVTETQPFFLNPSAFAAFRDQTIFNLQTRLYFNVCHGKPNLNWVLSLLNTHV